MLKRFLVRARRLYLQSAAHRSTDPGAVQGDAQRLYSSKVPREYQGYYLHKPLQPKPRAVPEAATESLATSSAQAAPAAEAAGDIQADISTQSARTGVHSGASIEHHSEGFAEEA